MNKNVKLPPPPRPAPPPAPPSPAQLRRWVLSLRKAGLSWRSVAVDLGLAGVSISHETLRSRFAPKPAPASRPLSVESVCLALRPLIDERRAAGAGWSRIESELRQVGVDIAVPSLRVFISKGRRPPKAKGA